MPGVRHIMSIPLLTTSRFGQRGAGEVCAHSDQIALILLRNETGRLRQNESQQCRPKPLDDQNDAIPSRAAV